MTFDDYKPMLACPVDIDKVDKYSNYTMEVKLDGVRCIAIKDPTGHVGLWTRSGKELTHKLEHICAQLRTIRGHFVIDGELGYCTEFLADDKHDLAWPSSIDFNATMRVLGSDPPQAKLKQAVNQELGMPRIKFFVFDILQKGNYPAYRLKQSERREGLRDLLENLSPEEGLLDVEMTPEWPSWDESLYTAIVSNGGEGVMLKNPDAIYYPGKRKANTWYKVKAFDTIDCKIVGAMPGQGKYEGAIGALVVEDPTGTKMNVSGMSDDVRMDMTTHLSTKYMNKMCEVRYFGKVGENKDGYRHPQYLRMRPDLDAATT
jgi:ATP-dependent DNA ligase